MTSSVQDRVTRQINGAADGSGLSTRSRPKPYIVLLVALVVGFSALAFWLYSQAGQKVPVVVAATDISAGHVIDRSDLSTVEVAGGVTAVAAGHMSSLLGQRATVAILAGTLVQRAMVSNGPAVPSGQTMVGVAVPAGQLPSVGLSAGSRVEVLQLIAKDSSAGGQGTSTPTPLAAATVYDSRADPATAGQTLLTLIVPASSAGAVAQASSAGLIALLQLGG